MIEKEEEEEGGGGEITTTFSIFHKRKCGRRVATQLTRLTLVKSTSKSTWPVSSDLFAEHPLGDCKVDFEGDTSGCLQLSSRLEGLALTLQPTSK